MFHLLPAQVLYNIFDATNSLSSATALAKCSRFLNTAWKKHLKTLDLTKTFNEDPRWRGPKYQFFAVCIARGRLALAGVPRPTPQDALMNAYELAGIINSTAKALHAELAPQCPDMKNVEIWNTWLEYVLAKSLYMLWIIKMEFEAPSDPRYFVATKEMVEFLMLPWWRKYGYPELKGVRGAKEHCETPPLDVLLRTCLGVDERVKRNKKVVGVDVEDDELDSDDEPNLEDEFYDDSELDELDELDEFDTDDDIDGFDGGDDDAVHSDGD
ncbi:hypothetical protein BDD12DRAFT_838980 [Trichophaea hybrida]|nr:hypothetical protein BDD12DRAFT_838980 [Trichophaea hybrida]